jgi:hypothetical protein
VIQAALWFACGVFYRIASIDKPICIDFPEFPGIQHRAPE